MLKATTKGFDESLYTKKIERILDLPKELEDKALEAAVYLEAQLPLIYETAPPRGSNKFVWSSDPAKDKAARGWWFWQLKLGNIPTANGHYKRSGKPPYSVTVDLSQGQRGVSFRIEMKNPKMRFPFGGLNGVDTRNPGHKTTGWRFASPLVDKATNEARKQLLAEMASYIKEL